MDFTILSNYLVVVVIGVCCCIGYLIKTCFNNVPNKYIPLILAIVGVVSNIFVAKQFNIDVLLGGMLSGLASTGCHQAFKNLIKADKKESMEDDDNEN